MQLLWFLPSIAYGVMLAVTSGNYLLLVSTIFSAVLMLLVRWRISLRPKLGVDSQLRVLGNRIWIDDFRLPRGSAFWSREHFDFVFEKLAPKISNFGELFENYQRHKNTASSRLTALVGFDSEELIQVSIANDGPHAIIVGPTGSGKTEFLKNFVKQISLSTPDVDLVLIDFKGGSGLSMFKPLAKLLVTDQDLSQAHEIFEFLRSELRRREVEQDLAPMVVVIDELAHLLSEIKQAEQVLTSIAARGRSARMHLVVTNQNLVGIPRGLLSNMRLRVLVGQHDPVDAALLGQAAKPQPAPEVGYRLAQAQIIGHGQAGKLFWFTGFKPEQLTAVAPQASAPELLPRWSPAQRAHSSQVPTRRRHGRRRANRDLQALARRGASHWLARR